MRYIAPTICMILMTFLSISRADDIVSLWSKGAGAFLSTKGKTPRANSLSVGKTEEFLLKRSEKAENQDQVTIVGLSGHRLGTFILEPQGNSYFAIKKKNGSYLSFDKAGKASRYTGKVRDSERIAIVPVRAGAKVCIRAYQGWEAKIHVDHLAEFPTLKTNVNTLQITPLLNQKFYSKELLTAFRESFSTDSWETEYILNKTPDEIKANPDASNLKGLLQRVILMESLGYKVDYLIVYREPLVKGHAPGPWSDKRILAQSDVDAISKMFKDAHAKRVVKHKSYKLVALAYQFDTKPANDSSCGHLTKGLDDRTRAFIKKNFWGLSVEVNSHDWSKKKEHIDSAMAAEWCKANKLQLIITSGGAKNRDRGYKAMYEKIFAEMKTRNVDPASPWLHYVLHHVFQPRENRLPEWEKDTTAENAKWLIEKVQKIER